MYSLKVIEKYLSYEKQGKAKRHTKCPPGNCAEADFVQPNKLYLKTMNRKINIYIQMLVILFWLPKVTMKVRSNKRPHKTERIMKKIGPSALCSYE